MKKWIDEISLYICSGRGGAGSVHFLRARFLPRGGPDGGDGGDGGDFIVKGDNNISSLGHLAHIKSLMAEDGKPGQGRKKSGKRGRNSYLKVPFSTSLYDTEKSLFLGKVCKKKKTILLFSGGKGGRGNYNFKTSTKQTPYYAQPGLPGEGTHILFSFSIVAEIGLVGQPNVGRSSFLASVSSAKPKIGTYDFTTTIPELARVDVRSNSFLVVDLPGIIQDSSQGKGKGISFLKHIVKCKVLLFFIDGKDKNPSQTYNILKEEIKKYNPTLLTKHIIPVITKIDLCSKEELISKNRFLNCSFISSTTGEGIIELLQKLDMYLK